MRARLGYGMADSDLSVLYPRHEFTRHIDARLLLPMINGVPVH